ncbi:MAG: heme exporter protein CcmD [Gammaproteobacteria bacterium]|nr:heme exporter protein CcmD [Gammaproteobacteria bacterium]
MSFDSFSAFLAMGGHGLYVWSAYAVTLVVFAFNAIKPVLMHKRFLQQHKQLQRRELARENTAQ